jgi:hypothetical protein
MRPIDPITDSAVREALKEVQLLYIALASRLNDLRKTQILASGGEIRRGPLSARGSAEEHKSSIYFEERQDASKDDAIYFSVQLGNGNWDWARAFGAP